MAESFIHGYALLIGVGESAYAAWSLPVTVRDAKALRSILVDPNLCAYAGDEDHIRLLSDAGATRQAVLDGLAWLAARAAADQDATAVVYYSGHGWLDRTTDLYYLVTHDVSPFDVARSTVPAQAFTQGIRDVKARRLLVVMDCCHAEQMATAKGEIVENLPPSVAAAAVPKGLVDDLKQGEGRAVFTSCRAQQRSWTRPGNAASVYTYHLLEALQGAGSHPGDTVVCLSNLMGYLAKAVPESARRLAQAEQTPFFDTASEDFPVAVLRGGKGLPGGGWQAVQPEAERAIAQVYRATLTGSGAIAQGTGAQAAGERGVVGRDIAGPVMTGDGSAAASGGGAAVVGSGNIIFTGPIQGPVSIVPGGRPGQTPGGQSPAPAGTGSYDLAAVSDLLLAGFTASDLRRLLLYTNNAGLRPLVREFGPGDGLATMVERVIEFCVARDLLPDLLREVERANPRQYGNFANRLRVE